MVLAIRNFTQLYVSVSEKRITRCKIRIALLQTLPHYMRFISDIATRYGSKFELLIRLFFYSRSGEKQNYILLRGISDRIMFK